MLARVNTVALDGIAARPVEVEVDICVGMPALNMVGLAEGAVREAKDRVRAAINNSGYRMPSRRITINLAPADLPKGGSSYDLPMALGLLAALEKLPEGCLDNRIFLGELALDGRIKPVPGCLPTALYARKAQMTELIVPFENGPEAALVPNLSVFAPTTLLELTRHLHGETLLQPLPETDWQQWLQEAEKGVRNMRDVKGQEHAKRALEVVAAGGHNLIMTGPPGSGKTFLARCLPSILPPMTLEEALDVTAIHSVAGKLPHGQPLVGTRPFRTPHHTASRVALIGGGSSPRPGEVSLAHRGILFLDEIPEFGRNALEVLREPLESGEVIIARAARTTGFPADFQLIAACNPCPCGNLGNPVTPCTCSPVRIENYRARLSGPLLDRIDLHVDVPPVPPERLISLPNGEPSLTVRARVIQARNIQFKRNGPGLLNAALEGENLERVTQLDDPSRTLMLNAGRKLGFSARTHHRLLKVARTIADLAKSKNIQLTHLAEAIQYRMRGGTE
ncbi:MAG: YifB family Mg chelatase-like AAA ATPase [Magnetococcus sp. DMHC-6]